MQQQPQLKLPPYDHRIQIIEGKECIWDIVRKKYVVLSPEEWVRQHFVNLLTQHLNYPSSLFKIESSLNYAQKKKRSDIQVLDTYGEVLLLVECKSPSIKLSKKTVNQLSLYNKSLNAKHIAITNGIKHYVWKRNPEKDAYLIQDQFPMYSNT